MDNIPSIQKPQYILGKPIPPLRADNRIEGKLRTQKFIWVVLNNLKEFNDKPYLIQELANRFAFLITHSTLYKFAPLFDEAVKYFDINQTFPEIEHFNHILESGSIMQKTNERVSMDMFTQLCRQLDYEIIIQEMGIRFTGPNKVNQDLEGMRYFTEVMLSYLNRSTDTATDSKEDWINNYENYIKEYVGLKTHIREVDEQIGKFSGLVTIAAPSSHGKSTFALSMAHNMAAYPDDTGKGRNVLYITFEMPASHIKSKLVSIESAHDADFRRRLEASDIIQQKLNDEQRQAYSEHSVNLLNRIKASGGFISIMDNTSMSLSGTIEEFMTAIENHSEKLGINFDIIFIDNVDSLNTLQGQRGQDDMGKMNTFITKLDGFSKTYMKNAGTCVVLLSQTNREGLKKLKSMEANNSEEITVDFTVLQRYSSLYERATMVLILYSSAVMRATGKLKLMPVKLRNKALPTKPITLSALWQYSYVGDVYVNPQATSTEIKDLQTQMQGELSEDDFMVEM